MNQSNKVIAIIPARGGSKRIPRKNLMPFLGRPLVAHTILHALHAETVDQVYVSTDDPEIAETAKRYGATPIMRPDHLSGDSATSESAILDVLDQLNAAGTSDPGLVVFLQCTSPFRLPSDIDEAINQLRNEKATTLFSASRIPGFVWSRAKSSAESVTFDYQNRKKTQDMPPFFHENGSIYIFPPFVLREEGNRLKEPIAIYEMDGFSFIDIDSEEDYEFAEWVFKHPKFRNIIKQSK